MVTTTTTLQGIVRLTTRGCACLQSWTFGEHEPCLDHCCNPDGDASEWCFVANQSCQGSTWGYCEGEELTTVTTTSGAGGLPSTVRGCSCLQYWSLAGLIPCSTYCCNPDGDMSPWCFVADTTCEGANWGYCSSNATIPQTPTTTTVSEPVHRFTVEGCHCQNLWTLPGHTPCSTSCCNPNNDTRDWCLVWDQSCQGSSWGYCTDGSEITTTASLAPRSTAEGCACKQFWSWANHDPCLSHCCNPDGDVANWCIVVDEVCQGSSWGYCAAETTSYESNTTPVHAAAGRVTAKGCACQTDWVWQGQQCLQSCCNPDGDVADWCFVVDSLCERGSWGYCTPDLQAVAVTSTTTVAGPTATVTQTAMQTDTLTTSTSITLSATSVTATTRSSTRTSSLTTSVTSITTTGSSAGTSSLTASVTSTTTTGSSTGTSGTETSSLTPSATSTAARSSTGTSSIMSSASSTATIHSATETSTLMPSATSTAATHSSTRTSSVTSSGTSTVSWTSSTTDFDKVSSTASASTDSASSSPPTTVGIDLPSTTSPSDPSVTGSMMLSLPDCGSFISEPGSQAAMETALATVSGTAASAVPASEVFNGSG